MAEDWLVALLVAFQKVPVPSLNSVPPTAVTLGGVLRPETARPVPVAAFDASQPDAPLSPVDTKAEIPSAAACDHRLL